MADINPVNKNLFTVISKDPKIKGKKEDLVFIPKVVVVNKFTEESAKQFYGDMSEAENNPQEIIPIVIDSYGGHIYSLLSMIDCVNLQRRRLTQSLLVSL